MATKQPRGNILLITVLLVIPITLIMAGIAVDVAMLLSTRSELHRTTDAAALAGAGKLAFDETVFPTARQFAHDYAAANPYLQTGAVSLNLNSTNSHPSGDWPWPNQTIPAGGDVILGIWDPTKTPKFQPSTDGLMVNAVLCRTAQNIPTYFLNMIGLTSLSMSAESIATSNPPTAPPTCPLPFAPSFCSFVGAGGFNSSGCGAFATFSTSSGNTPGTAPAATNTSAWINFGSASQPPNQNDTQAALDAYLSGNCSYPLLQQNQPIGATNGEGNNAVVFANWFKTQWNTANKPLFTDFSLPKSDVNPGPITKDGQTTYGNIAPAWGLKAAVPIIDLPAGTDPVTACAGGVKAIHGGRTVTTFAWFVVTQATDNNGDCAVWNPADSLSRAFCPCPNNYTPSNGECVVNLPQKDKSPNTVFGYYDCGGMWGTPTITPAPRAALATKLRIVN